MRWALALFLVRCFGLAANAQDGLPPGLALVPQTGHSDTVHRLQFSADGRRLASGDWHGLVVVWDVQTGEQGLTLELDEPPQGVALSPDGLLLATTIAGRGVLLWDVARGDERGSLSLPGVDLCGCAFSPDGRRLLTGSHQSAAYIWDIGSRRPLVTLDAGVDSKPTAVAFSLDGARVATDGGRGRIVVWDAASGEPLCRLYDGSSAVHGLAFSPDGTRLATAEKDFSVAVWRVPLGLRVATLTGHTQGVGEVAFGPDGTTLATTQGEGNAIVWDVEAQSARLTIKENSPFGLAFSPDGRALALGGWHGSVDLRDPDSGALLRTLGSPKARVYQVAVHANSRRLAAGMSDGAIAEWDLQTGQRLHRTFAHGGSLALLEYASDGETLCSLGHDGGWSGSAATWRAGTGEGLTWRPVGEFASAAWHLEHHLLVTGGKQGQVELWDLETFEHKPTASAQKWWVKAVAISPDGRTVAAGSMDDTIIFWDGVTGAELRRLKAPTRWLSPLAFSPDGSSLAIGNTSGGLWLWDLAGDRALHSLKRGLEYAPNFAFSPEGRELAWGGYEAAVHLMDVKSGEVRALPTSSNHVYGVVFTPDGRRVVSGGDGALRVWDRGSGALLVTLWDTPPTEASSQGEWVAWTPEGYYDCSPGGEAYLRVRDTAGGLHSAGEYAYLFRKPERVREALAR